MSRRRICLGGRFTERDVRQNISVPETVVIFAEGPHSLAAALAAGGTAAVATLAGLMRCQGSAWKRSASTPIITDQDGEAPAAAPDSS
jgi:hypothetical protein